MEFGVLDHLGYGLEPGIVPHLIDGATGLLAGLDRIRQGPQIVQRDIQVWILHGTTVPTDQIADRPGRGIDELLAFGRLNPVGSSSWAAECLLGD